MNAFSTYEQFLETKKQNPNARLKLIAHIDNRTREQSKEMNKQISNANGEFLYPDGKYYRLGTAPAQWCINDRETQTIVFFSDKEEKENREAARNINREDTQFFKNIDNQSMQDVAGIQEVKEIENKIKEIGEFAFVDLSEMPLNLIKDIYITSNKIFTKYPQLKGGYGIELSEKITENGFADIISNNLSIQLNKKLFIDKKLLEKEYLKSVELNIHPKNTNYNAILIHEYGHALGEYIEKGKGISKLKIRNDVLKRAGYKTSDIEEKLSNSVSINSSEFFAEAFAEYLNSSKPRKIAKVFGQYLNEILD